MSDEIEIKILKYNYLKFMQEHKTLQIRSRVFQGLVRRHLSKEQFKAIMEDLDALVEENRYETEKKRLSRAQCLSQEFILI